MIRALRLGVRVRAGDRCEYCQLHQIDSPFVTLHVEHIIPKKHGGEDDFDNLFLACGDWNLRKGSNLAGIDPVTGKLIALFHPRLQNWSDHFAWKDLHILGRTAVGRTTVRVLDLNHKERLEMREAIAGG